MKQGGSDKRQTGRIDQHHRFPEYVRWRKIHFTRNAQGLFQATEPKPFQSGVPQDLVRFGKEEPYFLYWKCCLCISRSTTSSAPTQEKISTHCVSGSCKHDERNWGFVPICQFDYVGDENTSRIYDPSTMDQFLNRRN